MACILIKESVKPYQNKSYDAYDKGYFEWLGVEVHKTESLKMLKKLLFGLSLLTAQVCWAADTYDPATNQLTIQSVSAGGTVYNDVVVTVGGIVRLDGGTPSGSVDIYDFASNQLLIPSVLVNGTTYTNVVISVGQIVSVGAGSSSGGSSGGGSTGGGSTTDAVTTNSSSVLVTTFIAIN